MWNLLVNKYKKDRARTKQEYKKWYYLETHSIRIKKINIELKWFKNKKLSNLNMFDALKDDPLVHIYRSA